jgi:hypothetical protein
MPHPTGYENKSKDDLRLILNTIYGVQSPQPDAVQKLARVLDEILRRLPDES